VAFGLEASRVKVIGVLPAGLAGPSLPGVGLDAVPQLIGGALGSEERAGVLTDLLAFIRERAARAGTSAASAEFLAALDARLSAELAAAHGAGAQAPEQHDGVEGPAPR
jgi:hypothetical protein